MRLHHVDHGGAGPVVVLLHAFPLDSTMWDRLVPLVRERLRAVTVDLPGLGGSPVPEEDPDLGAVARAVLRTVTELGVDTFTPFGISTGGYVALELAASAPGRLASLVLGSTSTRLVSPDDPGERRRTAEQVESAESTEPVAGSADEGLGPTATREQPGLVAELRSVIDASTPEGVAWMARAIASRRDTSDVLVALPAPVLLVAGAEDTATPPSYAEDMQALRDPGRSRLVVLPGTGHLTALEQPAAVAAALLDLLLQPPSEP